MNAVTEVSNAPRPSLYHIPDIRAELFDPPIGGAVTILNSTQRHDRKVRRVVMVTSYASKLCVLKALRGSYTIKEVDRKPMLYRLASSAPVVGAYSASKALTEIA